ncbi:MULTISPECIES: ABC transporter substrate-binding protein [Streptosporangium]|uniref:Leucine-binding protein domain-containing protein n=1 Tax=Streptosporangium brasiliense TaxID=47480 RepID=A0ABT9RG89_9ACTN|nr:ABC transporter substrate-binding protein [Streptosporangium brasiliense]MDP9867739.1 hypothetical protein [Streptosporangium brasiliense]
MTIIAGTGRATRPRSPLVRPLPAARAAAPAQPAGHTAAEVAALVEQLTAARPRIETVTVGHGRDAASRAAAQAFVRSWEAAGGTVLAVVDWPEEAASWLRPARRFAAGDPDAWVVAGAALGWAQMSRRLRHSTGWQPRRTYAFACLGDVRVVELAGPATLEDMRGVAADGSTWRIGRGLITYYPHPDEGPR